MQLLNSFEISSPATEAWPLVTNVDVLVDCIPGAELTGRNDDHYDGKVTVRVGPVTLTFVGSIEVREVDADALRMVVHGTAREQRGQGTIEAKIEMRLSDGTGATSVTVQTDVELGGKAAQFGTGVIQKISERIINQFAQRLERRLSGATPVSTDVERATDTRAEAAPHSAAQTSRTGQLQAATPLIIASLGGLIFGWSAARFRPQRQP